jgi:hypothetical protein
MGNRSDIGNKNLVEKKTTDAFAHACDTGSNDRLIEKR